MHLSGETRQLLLTAAREILLRRLSNDPSPLTFLPHPELTQPAGCFVSLHTGTGHTLRGCIGVVDAAKPLAESLATAAESVLDDPRFKDAPVTLEELPDLEIEITLLGPLQPAPSPLDFNPQTDGIHLTIGNRAGLFLPQVARETGWTRQELLSRLCTEKMDLAPDAWNDVAARLQIFSAIVIVE